MNARLVAAMGVLSIIVIVTTFFGYQSWNGTSLHSTYKLGDEIKGFPVSEMSLTVYGIDISKTNSIPNVGGLTGGLPSNSNYVSILVTIKNLENSTLYFNQTSDFMNKYSKTLSQKFVLTYGEENHEAYPQTGYLDTNGTVAGRISYGWDFDINIASSKGLTSLAPNQTVWGSLIFLVDEQYAPNQLICREGSNSNPNFVVNLKT